MFVFVEVAAELPGEGFGSCRGLNLPVIWGSETRSRGVREEHERWKRRDTKWNIALAFICSKTLVSVCVCVCVRCLFCQRCSCHKDLFLQGQCLGDTGRSFGFVMGYLV